MVVDFQGNKGKCTIPMAPTRVIFVLRVRWGMLSGTAPLVELWPLKCGRYRVWCSLKRWQGWIIQWGPSFFFFFGGDHYPNNPCMVYLYTYIYHILPLKTTKCRQIYHTWMIWGRSVQMNPLKTLIICTGILRLGSNLMPTIYDNFEDSLGWCRGMTPPRKESNFKLQRSHHFFFKSYLGEDFGRWTHIFALWFDPKRHHSEWVFVVVCGKTCTRPLC